MRGLLSSVKKCDYIRYTIRVLEESRKDMTQQTQILGHPVNQQCCVFDLENFSLKHVTWKPGKEKSNGPVHVKHRNHSVYSLKDLCDRIM